MPPVAKLFERGLALRVSTRPRLDFLQGRDGFRQEREDRVDVHGVLNDPRRHVDARLLGPLGKTKGIAQQHFALAGCQEYWR